MGARGTGDAGEPAPLADSRRPDRLTIAALAVAVVAISSSASLIVLSEAPPLAVAFWRNAAAAALLAPFLLVRPRVLGRLGRSGAIRCTAAGVALAVHFATWVPSTTLTSVATSTALVCVQPVWAGLLSVAAGRRLPAATWLGIGVAVLGAAVATGADVSVSTEAVVGDLLALVGGMAGAVYVTVGERVRVAVSTVTYTGICYSVCAVLLGVTCLVAGVPLAGYAAASWLAIAGLVAGPQFLGHSLVNYALHKVPATVLSVVLLLEVPGAALLGVILLDQVPRLPAIPGLVLVVTGVAVVVLGGRRRGRAGTASGTASDPAPDPARDL